MSNEALFQFNILRILDCGFTVEEGVDIKNELEAQIGYGMNFSFDAPKDWIQYLLKAEFRTIGNQKTFITGTVLTKFGVLNLNSYIEEESKISFPAGSLELLFEISFNHLRAILAKNLSGTIFSDFYLPTEIPFQVFRDLLAENIKMHKELIEQKPQDASLIPSQGL